MRAAGEAGSIVTLLCDGGERYAHTYFSDDWLAAQGLDLDPHLEALIDALGQRRAGQRLTRRRRRRPSACRRAIAGQL